MYDQTQELYFVSIKVDEPTVKRHILGNKGEFEQENKSEVSLSLTSKNLKLEFSEDLGDDSEMEFMHLGFWTQSASSMENKGSYLKVNSFI